MNKLNLIFKYSEEFSSIFIFVLSIEIIELCVIFLSVILFLTLYWNNSIVRNLWNYFKLLPLRNKFFLVWFTVFFAVPNKICVNNKVPLLLTSLLVFSMILVSYIFPIFILLYITFWLTVLESYFFAVVYEDRVSFRNFVNNALFTKNAVFAKEYFSFFWGNMNSGGAGKSKAGLLGTVFGGLYKLTRDNEKQLLRVTTQKEMAEYMSNAEHKFKTPEEASEFRKKVEEHITDRDLPILRTERSVQKAADKFSIWWDGAS